MSFLNFSCSHEQSDSAGSTILYEVECIKHSIQEKILVNDFMITKMTFNKLNINENNRYMDFNLILTRINQLLIKFYKDDTLFQWSSIDWLSGNYLFNEKHKSADMNKLKAHKIKINEKFMTMDEIYNQLLPWNSNMNTILIFHNILMSNIAHMMNEIQNKVLNRLKKTFKCYTLGTKKFFKYLESPAISYIPPENVILIISAVEKILPGKVK